MYTSPDNAECTTKFLDGKTLVRIVKNYLAIEDVALDNSGGQEMTDQQLVFPDMKFTCNSTITTLIIGADILREGELSAVPEIQTWRLEDRSNTYIRVQSIPLSTDVLQDISIGLNVYQLQTSISFTSGDILGIYYPSESDIILPNLIGHGSVVERIDLENADVNTLNQTRQWPLIAFKEGTYFKCICVL